MDLLFHHFSTGYENKKIISDLGITKTHVSLADERDYAIAIAVLEK